MSDDRQKTTDEWTDMVKQRVVSDLRREAEALLKKWFDSTLAGNLDSGVVGHSEEEWKRLEAAIEAAFKALLLKEVEAMEKRVRDGIGAGRPIGDAWMINWLTQRTDELKP